MRRSRIEQETIILFNEEEKTASVYTFNKSIQRKLSQLSNERPDECYLDNPQLALEGAVEYIIPKKWIKLRASRILSDEQKEELSERAKAMRKSIPTDDTEDDFEES